MNTCGDFGGVTASGEPCRHPAKDGKCHHHADEHSPAGRPLYEPTAQEREFVKIAAMGGMPQEDILAGLPIDDTKTLRKHFREELDTAYAKANARVVQTAFKQATSGKSPAMTMFWLKTRMGWKETEVREVEHSMEEGGSININFPSDVPKPE